MSEENVKLVYRSVESLSRKDLDGFLALLADDVRLQPQLGEGEQGRDAIRRWWKIVVEGISDLSIEVVEVREVADDLTLTTARVGGRGRTSAMPFDQTYRVPARWREGKCVWWGVFLGEQDALEAAGLSE
jgi:uncharacterized protein (TIGR02246 family)